MSFKVCLYRSSAGVLRCKKRNKRRNRSRNKRRSRSKRKR